MAIIKPILSIAIFAGTLFSSVTYAEVIDIKGLSIGMPKDEVEPKIARMLAGKLTIGDVPVKLPAASPEFHEGKLDSLDLFFSPGAFNQVVAEIQKKYPNLKCKNSTVTNASGDPFTQTQCSMKGERGVLQISRFASGLSTAGLNLISERKLKELSNVSQKKTSSSL